MDKAATEESKTSLEKDVDDLTILQGFGKKLNVFMSMKDGKPQYKVYHIAPAPIKDIPELTKLIFQFQEAATKAEKQGQGFKEKDVKAGAQMVMMGLKKTMPEVEEEEIMENFSFGVMIQASTILIDVNDLGTQIDSEGNVVENPTQPIRRATPN